MQQIIWIATYWGNGLVEPTVTPFDNEEAANNFEEYFKEIGFSTCVDKCVVYSSFKSTPATK